MSEGPLWSFPGVIREYVDKLIQVIFPTTLLSPNVSCPSPQGEAKEISLTALGAGGPTEPGAPELGPHVWV